MKETIKSEIDEENGNEYINGYLKSRNLKKEDLKRREHAEQKEDWSKSGNGKKSVRRTVPLTFFRSLISLVKQS